MPYTHPKDAPTLCLTHDRARVVEEGSPDAAFVLVGPGGTLPDAQARHYGLMDEPKQDLGPAQNKAARPGRQNKGK